MDIYQKVMKRNTLAEVVLEVGLNYKKLTKLLVDSGVKHAKGQYWSKAVEDFLGANMPQQLDMFSDPVDIVRWFDNLIATKIETLPRHSPAQKLRYKKELDAYNKIIFERDYDVAIEVDLERI